MKCLILFLTFSIVSSLSIASNVITISTSSENGIANCQDQVLNEASLLNNTLTKSFFKENLAQSDYAHICADIAHAVMNTLVNAYEQDLETAIMVGDLVEEACCEFIPGC